MKKRNGFTLVELLAVIVVLAIIIVIAIPNVLTSLNTAKQKSFKLYTNRIFDAYKSKQVKNELLNNSDTFNNGILIKEIGKDTGVEETGNFEGYLVESTCNGKKETKIYIWDKDYEILGDVQNDEYNLVPRDQAKIDLVLAKLQSGSLVCSDLNVIDDLKEDKSVKKNQSPTTKETLSSTTTTTTTKTTTTTTTTTTTKKVEEVVDFEVVTLKKNKTAKIELIKTTMGSTVVLSVSSPTDGVKFNSYTWSDKSTKSTYAYSGGSNISVTVSFKANGVTDSVTLSYLPVDETHNQKS